MAPWGTETKPFGYCLNTSTVRGQGLSLVEELEIAARAGYDAVEPWMKEIEQYLESGGTLKELDQRLRDLGLSVESAVGFAEWVVEDDAQRARGMEQAQHDMDLLAQIGGKRMAAPPFGAHLQGGVSLERMTERYRALLDLGKRMGVVPQLELWGHSKLLSRLGEAAYVAIEAGHPQACLLLDVYHLHRGGSGHDGVRFLSGSFLQVFHVNDYPAAPPREQLTDADRVYPTDGAAPLVQLFRDLRAIGFRGALSLELFNRDYWEQDAFTVAKTGLEKMRSAVEASLA